MCRRVRHEAREGLFRKWNLRAAPGQWTRRHNHGPGAIGCEICVILFAMADWNLSNLSALSSAWFYLGLFLSAYIENIFSPMPGDSVTIFAGYLVGRSQRSIAGVFVFTNLGSIAGFMTCYAAGRLIHPEYFIRKNFRFLPATGFKTAGEWFQRWGYWVVLGNRFLSGIRSIISVMCGIYRLSWLKVLVLASVGCSIWNALMVSAGYFMGANWKSLEHILRQYSRALIFLLLLGAVVWWLRKRYFSVPPG